MAKSKTYKVLDPQTAIGPGAPGLGGFYATADDLRKDVPLADLLAFGAIVEEEAPSPQKNPR